MFSSATRLSKRSNASFLQLFDQKKKRKKRKTNNKQKKLEMYNFKGPQFCGILSLDYYPTAT